MFSSHSSYSVKRSDVSGNRFEWELSEKKDSQLGDNNGGQGYWASQNFK